jgi:hypothetical protein
MLSHTFRLLGLGLVAAPLGCQGPDITAELNDHQTLLNDVNGRLCECPDILGHQSTDECFDALGVVDEVERMCFEDALEGQRADGQDYLVCANAALQKYEQCLASNVDCDADVGDSCTSVYTVELAQCTQVPSDVRAAFAGCIP